MSMPDAPENELTADEGAPGTPGTAPVTPAGDEKALPADIAELSYEAARDQLVAAQFPRRPQGLRLCEPERLGQTARGRRRQQCRHR